MEKYKKSVFIYILIIIFIIVLGQVSFTGNTRFFSQENNYQKSYESQNNLIKSDLCIDWFKVREYPDGSWVSNSITADIQTELEFSLSVSTTRMFGYEFVFVTINLPDINNIPMFSYVEDSASDPINLLFADDYELVWIYAHIGPLTPRELTFRAIVEQVDIELVNLTVFALNPDTTEDQSIDSIQVTGTQPPVLGYSPTSINFGTHDPGWTGSDSFEIWNSDTGSLDYTISESIPWISVNPTSGSSTGEHDTITVNVIDTGSMSGYYSGTISISSNGGSGSVSVDITIEDTDTIPPEITDITTTMSNPIDTNPAFGWENITCTVTDNAEVDEVRLNITYPDLHTTNVSMTDGGGHYYNTSYSYVGGYSYYVWADDYSGNSQTSGTDTFEIPPNYDVKFFVDRMIDISDLNAVCLIFGSPVTAGSIREDVNNDGWVDISDLNQVCLHFGESW